MGKMKNFHYTMKDKEDWTDEDWEMYFEVLKQEWDKIEQETAVGGMKQPSTRQKPRQEAKCQHMK